MSIRINATLRLRLRARSQRLVYVDHALMDDDVIVAPHDDRFEFVLAPGAVVFYPPSRGGPFTVEGVDLLGLLARPLPIRGLPGIVLRSKDRLELESTTLLTLFAPEYS